jgi:hypothetical protein
VDLARASEGRGARLEEGVEPQFEEILWPNVLSPDRRRSRLAFPILEAGAEAWGPTSGSPSCALAFPRVPGAGLGGGQVVTNSHTLDCGARLAKTPLFREMGHSSGRRSGGTYGSTWREVYRSSDYIVWTCPRSSDG